MMIQNEIDWLALWPPVLMSLRVAVISSILSTLVGIGLAWRMSAAKWRGRLWLETFFMLPLVLPPTVVGFILLMALGRRSWIGQFAESVFSAPIVFSWGAAVIASIVVSFPLVYQTMKAGFQAIDPKLGDAARSGGAGEWQVFRYVTLPLVLPSVSTAYILSFARSLGEFGATLMVAGNIPGKTQTVPTAIYIAADSGRLGMAWMWTISMVVISFLFLLITGTRRGVKRI